MIRLPQRLPDPQAAWFDPQTGRPTTATYQYFRELDQAVRESITNHNANAITIAEHELRITDLETP